MKARLQITENMEEKYEQLIAEGKNENEALGIVISEFGSIEEIKKELGIDEEGKIKEDMTLASKQGDTNSHLKSLLHEYESFQPKYRIALAGAVVCFLMSVAFARQGYNMMPFFLLIALGIGILIYFVGRNGDYQRLIAQEKEELGLSDSGAYGYGTQNKRWTPLNNIITMSIVIIYLMMGFFFNLWHPGWMIFLFIPIIYSFLNLVPKDNK